MNFNTLKQFLVRMKLIEESHKNGFHLVLENGYTVSIQWKEGNYCDVDGSSAEIAAWDREGRWLRLGEADLTDDVIGWQTVDDALKLIIEISQK